MKIRLAADLQIDSIVDGLGVRTVIWTQGCKHKCKGCHNPETWSFDDGALIDINYLKKKMDKLEGQNGITFSGGDPFYQPAECACLAKHAHKLGLNVWAYTGFTYEQLLSLGKKDENIMDFLKEVDVLVDGPFMIDKKSFDVRFRGSSNQRLIDVKKSMAEGQTIELEIDKKEPKSNFGRFDHKMYI